MCSYLWKQFSFQAVSAGLGLAARHMEGADVKRQFSTEPLIHVLSPLCLIDPNV